MTLFVHLIFPGFGTICLTFEGVALTLPTADALEDDEDDPGNPELTGISHHHSLDAARLDHHQNVVPLGGGGPSLLVPTKVNYIPRNQFTFVLQISMVIIISLFLSSGLLGYLTFGKTIDQIVLLNLQEGADVKPIADDKTMKRDWILIVAICVALLVFAYES